MMQCYIYDRRGDDGQLDALATVCGSRWTCNHTHVGTVWIEARDGEKSWEKRQKEGTVDAYKYIIKQTFTTTSSDELHVLRAKLLSSLSDSLSLCNNPKEGDFGTPNLPEVEAASSVNALSAVSSMNAKKAFL